LTPTDQQTDIATYKAVIAAKNSVGIGHIVLPVTTYTCTLLGPTAWELTFFYHENCITLLGIDVSGTLHFKKLKPLIHLNICINKNKTLIM
jgi:hypothetical protein